MKGSTQYQIYQEVRRAETAIMHGEARPTESIEHTKGFLECMFCLQEIDLQEQIGIEDYIESLYTEMGLRMKESQDR